MPQNYKLPMVLMSLQAGILSGIFNSYLIGYLLHPNVIYASIIVPCAFLKLVIYNLSMSLYDQSENGPIFAAFFILIQINSGAVILDEGRLYSMGEMALLSFYSGICIIGICILAKKSNQDLYVNKK